MKEFTDKEKEFDDAANVIESSMNMWAQEFDKWHDKTESTMKYGGTEDDIDRCHEQLNFCLKRMTLEQEEAKKLENDINSHIIKRISEKE